MSKKTPKPDISQEIQTIIKAVKETGKLTLGVQQSAPHYVVITDIVDGLRKAGLDAHLDWDRDRNVERNSIVLLVVSVKPLQEDNATTSPQV